MGFALPLYGNASTQLLEFGPDGLRNTLLDGDRVVTGAAERAALDSGKAVHAVSEPRGNAQSRGRAPRLRSRATFAKATPNGSVAGWGPTSSTASAATVVSSGSTPATPTYAPDWTCPRSTPG